MLIEMHERDIIFSVGRTERKRFGEEDRDQQEREKCEED